MLWVIWSADPANVIPTSGAFLRFREPWPAQSQRWPHGASSLAAARYAEALTTLRGSHSPVAVRRGGVARRGRRHAAPSGRLSNATTTWSSPCTATLPACWRAPTGPSAVLGAIPLPAQRGNPPHRHPPTAARAVPGPADTTCRGAARPGHRHLTHELPAAARCPGRVPRLAGTAPSASTREDAAAI